jgi:hypothetical protein
MSSNERSNWTSTLPLACTLHMPRFLGGYATFPVIRVR